jgi:hypothetical protein
MFIKTFKDSCRLVKINSKKGIGLRKNGFHKSSLVGFPPQEYIMEDCSICFETITADTGHCTLGCAHTFHTACIGRWTIQTTASCPLCRKELGETEVLPKAPIIPDDFPVRQNTDTGQIDYYMTHYRPQPYVVQIDARPGRRMTIFRGESSPRIHIGNGIRVPNRDIVEVMSLGRVSRGSAIVALRENEGNVAEALYELDHPSPVEDEPEPPPRNLLEPTDDMFTAWALERLFTKGTIVIRNYHRFGSIKDLEERQGVMTFRHGFWIHPEYNDIVTIRRSRSF